MGGPRYVLALDGVRAIAIAGVFLLHLARAYVPGGAFGVDVFFVLSAYLITGLLLAEHRASAGIRFASFYMRRVFRLAPALIAWLVVASLTAIAAGQRDKVPWSVAGSMFYVSDFLQAWTDKVAAAFDQSWSLAVEEQFYLVWPALLLFILRFRQPVGRAALSVGVLAAAVIPGSYFLPTGHLAALLLGCWAAEQVVNGPWGWVRRIGSIPGVGIAALAVFAAQAFGADVIHFDRLMALAVDLAATLLILHILCLPTSLTTRALSWRLPTWVGQRSYGIYLYGLTLMQAVPMVIPFRLTYAAPIDVLVTAVVVAVSYRYFEAPLRSRGRAWLGRVEGHERISVAEVHLDG